MLAEHKLRGALVRELVAEAAQILADGGIDEPFIASNWLAEAAFGMSRIERLLRPDAEADEKACNLFRSMVDRRLQREPVQYITGRCVFMGLPIDVRTGVLIPRPETETVVEHALEMIGDVKNPRILDVGTGSGCIAIAIAHFRPDAEVIGCDISRDALRIAGENAARNSVDARFMEADILAGSIDLEDQVFDLIISNPPYIPVTEQASLEPEVALYEPREALFSGDDPQLFYRAIAAFGIDHLGDGASMVLETHADHAPGTEQVLRQYGYEDVQLSRDLSGRWRIASGRRIRDRAISGS
jgi:release factor glutamine methyltransferase